MSDTITIPKQLVEDAIWALEEVRTGEDHEVHCWEIAAKLKEAFQRLAESGD